MLTSYFLCFTSFVSVTGSYNEDEPLDCIKRYLENISDDS